MARKQPNPPPTGRRPPPPPAPPSTFANAKMAVPNAAGIVDAIKVLEQSHAAGNWILLAPDGRLWENQDPMRMFAVLAGVLQIDPMTRMKPNDKAQGSAACGASPGANGSAAFSPKGTT